MRNPNRIYPFLMKVAACWRQRPDLRFGQLICIVLGDDPFYMEDDDAAKMFDKFTAEVEIK